MEKITYGIDPHNKLITKRETSSSLPTLRRVLDGEFKMGKKNELIYNLKEPVSLEGLGHSPVRQIKIQGKWFLTKNHDLKLTLDRWSKPKFAEDITLKSEILAAGANYLAFTVTQRQSSDTVSARILKLEGCWQADKFNRLNFRVKKERGKDDILVFEGAWEISKKHNIIYTYQKSLSGRKDPVKRALILRGKWDIKSKHFISYEVDMSPSSALDFKIGAGKTEKNYIKYELKIGSSWRKTPVKRALTLYGRWRVKKNVGLLFEIEYERHHIESMTFGIEASIRKNTELVLALKNKRGEPLGMELTLEKRSVNGDATAFLRLLSTRNEKAVYLGAGARW